MANGVAYKCTQFLHRFSCYVVSHAYAFSFMESHVSSVIENAQFLSVLRFWSYDLTTGSIRIETLVSVIQRTL